MNRKQLTAGLLAASMVFLIGCSSSTPAVSVQPESSTPAESVSEPESSTASSEAASSKPESSSAPSSSSEAESSSVPASSSEAESSAPPVSSSQSASSEAASSKPESSSAPASSAPPVSSSQPATSSVPSSKSNQSTPAADDFQSRLAGLTWTDENGNPIDVTVIPDDGSDSESGGNTVDASDSLDKAIELVNEHRAANGLSELTVSDDLMELAAVRAKEIYEDYGHERPDGTTVYDAGLCNAEIIVSMRSSATDAVKAWKNSTAHNDIMLTDWLSQVGVGRYKNDWVMLFSR